MADVDRTPRQIFKDAGAPETAAMTMRIPPGYTNYYWELQSTHYKENGYYICSYEHYLLVRKERQRRLQIIEFQKGLDRLPEAKI